MRSLTVLDDDEFAVAKRLAGALGTFRMVVERWR